jgi:hypothetical protein
MPRAIGHGKAIYAKWARTGNGWGVFVPTGLSAHPQLGDSVEVQSVDGEIRTVTVTAIVRSKVKGTLCACMDKIV